MKIICFGLNCSAPEDLIQSLRCMFKNQEFENELIRRKIGFVVYANLNDRRKVHSQGFDRSKDNAQVSNNSCFVLFLLSQLQILWVQSFSTATLMISDFCQDINSVFSFAP